MGERPQPTIDSVTEALLQLDQNVYLDQIANPLVRRYSEMEFSHDQDPEINFALASLSPHPLDIKDINDKHIHYATMKLMLLGADMVETDIKPEKFTDEVLTERSRTGFWLFSQLAWLEITRRRYRGIINVAALFRATEETFREKFGGIFEERPLEEKVKMFNDAYVEAWNTVHEGGFTVINP